MIDRSINVFKNLFGVSLLSLALVQTACTSSSGGGSSIGSPSKETEGEAPATYLVFDACPGAYDSCGLWKMDGSSAPVELKAPASNFIGAYNFTYVNGKYFFTARDPDNSGKTRLWVTDGTSEGTQQLTFQNTLNDLSVEKIIPFGTKVLFVAWDNPADYADSIQGELYISDGTVAGTLLVKDINPGLGQSSQPSNFVVMGGKAYFSALHGDTGVELFVTDGTAAGTHILKDLSPGQGHGSPENLVKLGDRIVFNATSAEGVELWVSDGTEAGTTILKDIVPGDGSGGPSRMTVIDGKIYFQALDANGHYQPFVSDGTEAGTFRIAEVNPGLDTDIGWFMKMGTTNKVIFSARASNNSYKLYLTDGTLGNITPINASWSMNAMRPQSLGGLILFEACDVTYGCEPWVTDGTDSGTKILKDIYPSTYHADISNFYKLGEKLYFAANDGTNGNELWSTDGTSNGTNIFKDINPGSDSSFPFLDGYSD
ncbi:ELWxxDGT repeat protein [Bdellovibrio sp.]|uniref:ELWxxDGT repeat protein n=1 Tax=Bdellovibrio sp. TaxID=28201 RepID=UPI0039E38486